MRGLWRLKMFLPAWPRLKPGEGEYSALFPKGWCSYKGFSTDISMQFFSP